MEPYAFDAAYLKRLSARDREVEVHFCAYFSELILLRSRTRRLAADVIEDIRQETLVRVLQAVQKGNIREPERLGSFVLTTCNYVTMEFARSGARFTAMDPASPEPLDLKTDTEKELLDSQEREEVRAILAKMSPKDRDLLKAVFLDERSTADVCRQYGVDGGYLRVMLFRARRRFEEILKSQRHDRGKNS